MSGHGRRALPRDAFQRAFRRRSGTVDSADPLAMALYLVMRDHVPPGRMEDILEDSLRTTPRDPARFTNGWLARHAIDAARRLRRAR